MKDLERHLGEPVVRNRAPEALLGQPALNDVASRFLDGANNDGPGNLVIEHAQDIPYSFVQMLRQMKADSGSVREKEFMHVGCIPTIFVEHYLRQGFNVFEEPVRETCRRLIRDGLDSFVVTNKRF